MKRQHMARYGGLLAAAMAVAVTGVAATTDGGERQAMIRLDGRGSQLGVMVSDVDDAARPGVRIDAVHEGSAAAKAGAREGDLVVDFDGERVRSARQLTRLVQESPAGRAVKMTVLRNGATQSLDVTPSEEPTAFTWNQRPGDAQGELRDDIEREIRRGLRGRDMTSPGFDFRFDRAPGLLPTPALPVSPFVAGRGRLGVQVEALSDQLASYFGVASGGVLVSSVAKGSTAEKAGLKAGDVITTVNGATVGDARELVDELSEVRDGVEITLGIVRDKNPSTVKATLGAPERAPSRRPTPRGVRAR